MRPGCPASCPSRARVAHSRSRAAGGQTSGKAAECLGEPLEADEDGRSDGPGKRRKPGGRSKAGPYIGIEATDSETVSRSEPQLQKNGRRLETLGINSDLRFTTRAGVNDKRGDGVEGSVFHGRKASYDVTVSEDRAERIADGDAQPPNPLDPRTLRRGEGVVLGTEKYQGSGTNVSFRFVRVGDSHEKGELETAGVQRVGKRWVRVHVGDEDTVRDKIALGLGTDDVHVSAGRVTELRDGKKRLIDLNIGTRAGWEAYQRFVGSGNMPAPRGRGRRNAATQTSWKYSSSSGGEVTAGAVSLADSSESGISETDTRYLNGRRDKQYNRNTGDVGLEQTSGRTASGRRKPSRTTILLQEADSESVETAMDLRGTPPELDEDPNVRIDFDDEDLQQIKDDALGRISQDSEYEMSPEEIEQELQEDPYGHDIPSNHPVMGTSIDIRQIASSKTPAEVGRTIDWIGRGDPYRVLEILNELQLRPPQPEDGLRPNTLRDTNPDVPGTVAILPDD